MTECELSRLSGAQEVQSTATMVQSSARKEERERRPDDSNQFVDRQWDFLSRVVEQWCETGTTRRYSRQDIAGRTN